MTAFLLTCGAVFSQGGGRRLENLTRFGRVVQAALYVQVALAIFAGTGYLLHLVGCN
jgi:hypothetical protein